MGRGGFRVLLAVLGASPSVAAGQRFVVTDTSVRQGRFEAVAVSRDRIVSSYPRAAREVRFRFSLNGAENEFPSGTEHTIYLRPRGGKLVTPVYRFGHEDPPPPPTAEQSASSEEGVGQVTFRLDLRPVLSALRTAGRYNPPLGAPIARGELKHVYVLGDPEPLSWDYGALRPGSPAELADPDGDGIYEATVAIRAEYSRPRLPDGRAVWSLSGDLAGFPVLASPQRIQDAVYRLSLEELRQLVRPDGALAAGAKWPGVWTRDVAMSTLLSLAIVAPDAARASLLAKVDTTSGGRIIQDTGTGGSWPVSSDRMVWTLAAWEVYAVTGDRQWLRRAYDISRHSAEADLHAVRDRETGLFRGESSFMDWREQSYPRWMQPADIYSSHSLSTNAVHYGAYRVLGDMARALGEPAARWDSVAVQIQRGMTRELWQPESGQFAGYLYGRRQLVASPRSDGLGAALAVITGAATAEQGRAVVRRTPVVATGLPSFWPFTPGERLYHNATVWPFVTAFWTWASADAGNTVAVRRGLDQATRSAALFLTNKENTVAATGHYEGTALNSDRQLWSVAGTLAGTYRVLFGIRLDAARMVFRPMVPPSHAGPRTLSGLRYRDASLAVTVHGYGDAVASARLDGVAVAEAAIPATLRGSHTLDITLNGRWPASAVNEVPSRFAPATPQAHRAGNRIHWRPVAGARRYVVYRNGDAWRRTTRTSVVVSPRDGLDEYQVLAVSADGDESFLSEPLRVMPVGVEHIVSAIDTTCTQRSIRCPMPLSTSENLVVQARPTLPAGRYLLDVRYANGSGPVNTEDKAAVRTLLVRGDTAGVIVMPQRGAGRWSEWGYSNAVRITHAGGALPLTLVYTPLDANMNGRENRAILDYFRLTRPAGDSARSLPRGTR